MAIFVAENGRQARLQTINNNHNKKQNKALWNSRSQNPGK